MTREEAVGNLKHSIRWNDIPKKEALDMAVKALDQEPCDVPDINDGNIYECPCGYGWDKSKVVRHHFCPNCGRAVNSSYNSIKTELKPCEDAISRQAVLDIAKTSKSNWIDNSVLFKKVNALPSINPQPKTGRWIFDEIIDKHYYCSECKSMGVDYWDFCPNCGAKMVEV